MANPDQADFNGDGIGDMCTPTSTGSQVTVQPAANATITFESVSQAGTTGVTTLSSGPAAQPNFSVIPLGSPKYYDISSTASFEGQITVCMTYDDADVQGEEGFVRMMHYRNGAWEDITSTRDTAGNVICGRVNSFSYFALMKFNCCGGQTGNVDCDGGNSVDISDLSALIDNLYITFTPLCCPRAANVDGQPGIDISDLSALIDYLYITFSAVAACD